MVTKFGPPFTDTFSVNEVTPQAAQAISDAGGGGGGAVPSVFGRVGAVVALAADYAAFYLAKAAGSVNALVSKAVPVGADVLLLEDSAAGFAQKKIFVSSLPIVYPLKFDSGTFVWVAGTDITVTHNVGRRPDLVTVWFDRLVQGWVNHYDYITEPNLISYGWRTIEASTPNAEVISLLENQDGAVGRNAKIRLFWFSAVDVPNS